MDKGFHISVQEFTFKITKNLKGKFYVNAMLLFQ